MGSRIDRRPAKAKLTAAVYSGISAAALPLPIHCPGQRTAAGKSRVDGRRLSCCPFPCPGQSWPLTAAGRRAALANPFLCPGQRTPPICCPGQRTAGGRNGQSWPAGMGSSRIDRRHSLACPGQRTAGGRNGQSWPAGMGSSRIDRRRAALAIPLPRAKNAADMLPWAELAVNRRR